MAVGNHLPLYLAATADDLAPWLNDTAAAPRRLSDSSPEHDLAAGSLYLLFDAERKLCLCQSGSKGAVCVDFVGGRAEHRRQQGGGELIAKAVNTKQHRRIIDATAGLGRDSFVLASLGCEVTLFEQNPVVAALLLDGLRRALQCDDTRAIAERMNLQHGSFLLAQPAAADVVYLDPMYPMRQKSAAVKKEMAYFHALVGAAAADDEAALLACGARCAEKRVVVKRPRLGECLAKLEPDYRYSGKSTRFDVYLPARLQDAFA